MLHPFFSSKCSLSSDHKKNCVNEPRLEKLYYHEIKPEKTPIWAEKLPNRMAEKEAVYSDVYMF